MRRILLGLNKSPGIGWKSIQKLILAGLDEQYLNLTKTDWLSRFNFLTEQQAQSLAIWLHDERLAEYEHDLAQNKIDYITVVDEIYPQYLKEIAGAPWLLFLSGKSKLLHTPSLAVVGSRKTTSYGRTVTEKLIPKLVEQGWTIVSGLALGIDSIAHQATIQADGKAIAVLGCGVDQIYPEQNKHLYHTLSKQGLLVSEYPPGTVARPAFFPQRNRIIAGLAHGVIVVEAAQKSGSLITAHYALEHGREVFAVPGSIFNPQSVGTNVLIQKHGAKLITNQDDITEEFNHIQLVPKITNSDNNLKQGTCNLLEEEQVIIKLLQEGQKHVNELQATTAFPFSKLAELLLKLELKGLVKALPGSYYQMIAVL